MKRTEAATRPAPVRPRGAPCLWFTRMPLQELVELLRERHFPKLRGPLRVQFAPQEQLVEVEAPASARTDGFAPITLSFHEVLNQAATPVEVFGALAKRAFARIDRSDAMRAPFAALCPEDPFADAWLDHFLGSCMVRRSESGTTAVTRRWQEFWLKPRPLPPALRLELARADAELLRFAL